MLEVHRRSDLQPPRQFQPRNRCSGSADRATRSERANSKHESDQTSQAAFLAEGLSATLRGPLTTIKVIVFLYTVILNAMKRHEQALVLIKKASKLLKTIVEEVYDECLQLKTSVEIQMMNLSKSPSQSNLTIACDDYFSISNHLS